eukprot:CAMPEP_0196580766 /NCGR_PEP_ID=MMETSP1081-20130531/30484_1 /TAXON_ID=36882 /ORGANISM="Pyramimonas amylifera, Strain CCMP720" /LENGTH=419 /DNA_ID=CAMNT_0041900743 /DNA_START=68 /DNA_END=1324 /DNA_ORIENTATION=-
MLCNSVFAVQGPLRTYNSKVKTKNLPRCQSHISKSPRKIHRKSSIPNFFLWGMPNGGSKFSGDKLLIHNGQQLTPIITHASTEAEMSYDPERRTPWPGPGAVVRARRRASTMLPQDPTDLSLDEFMRNKSAPGLIFSRLPGCCALDPERGLYQYRGEPLWIELLSILLTPTITFQARLSSDGTNHCSLEVVETEFTAPAAVGEVVELGALVELKASCTLAWQAVSVACSLPMCQLTNTTEVELQVRRGETFNFPPSKLQSACNTALQSFLDVFSDGLLNHVKQCYKLHTPGSGMQSLPDADQSFKSSESGAGPASPPEIQRVYDNATSVVPNFAAYSPREGNPEFNMSGLEDQILGLDDKLEQLITRNASLEEEIARRKDECALQELQVAELKRKLRLVESSSSSSSPSSGWLGGEGGE